MGEGGAGGFRFLGSFVSEPPCNRRIFHACHRLYNVSSIPCCRRRVSTPGCCVLHHRVLTFPHIRYSSSSPRFHQSQPSLRSCHGDCHFPVIPALSPLSALVTTSRVADSVDFNPASISLVPVQLPSYFHRTPHSGHHVRQTDNVRSLGVLSH